MRKLIGLVLVLGLFAAVPIVNADTIYQFTASNFTVSSPSPYGSVTLTDVGTGVVDVSVVLDSNLAMIMDSFGFSSGASSLTLSNVTSPYYGTWATPGQMDGFGYFNYIIGGPNWANGKNGTTNTLGFRVTGTGITEANLFTNNSSEHLFAAHVFDEGGTSDNQTGFITGGSTPVPVPEPASMLLLGTGLLGAGFFARRRKK